MKTKTHFTFRVDIWDDAGDSIVEHVAGADDFQVGRWRAGRRRALRCGRNLPAYLSFQHRGRKAAPMQRD
jgi:hypothetical protein